MKKSKKIASLIAIIFLLSTTLKIYAADYADTPTSATAEITLTPSTTQVKAGDTVTITVAAKCKTGIEGIDATLQYNKTKLNLKEEKAADGFTSMSGEDLVTGEYKISVLYTNTTDAPVESNFVTLTFEVLNTVTVDEVLSIKLEGIEVGDSDDEWMTVEDKEVSLTVITEQKPDSGEQKPDSGEQKPDSGEQKPDSGEQKPDSGEQKPDSGEQKPDSGEQKPSTEEQAPDNTIANKPINNAGLVNFASVAAVGIAVLTIELYAKCRKYKDVK